jgi:hypothetical protein
VIRVKKPELRIRIPVVKNVPLFGQFPIRDAKDFDLRHAQRPMPVGSERQNVWNSRQVLALGRQRRRELERKWNRIEKRSLPPTLAEATKRWLEKRASLASNTLETYKGALKHVRVALGSMLVCEIEARDIVAYQKIRLAQRAAGATVNKEVSCLSSILNDYGVWEQVRRDVKKLQEQ